MSVWQAIQRGDPGEVRTWLEGHPQDIGSAVQSAAQGEHVEVLDVVLQFAVPDWARDAALAQAAGRGAAAMVQRLLAAGAATTADRHRFPLWSAAKAGSVECLKLLLAAGADPNARVEDVGGEDHKFPLLAAVQGGSAEAVAVLLDAGADANAMTGTSQRPLDVAEALGASEIAALLRARGGRRMVPADLDLGAACRRGLVERVRELLPAASEAQRGSALLEAIQKQQPAAARAILEFGPLPAKTLSLALGQAIAFDTEDAAPALLGHGADKDAPDNYYHSPPLVLAADRGRVAVVRALLAAGAALQAKDEEGRNALAAAQERGHAEIVALLKAAGATTRSPAEVERATKKKLKATVRSAWTPTLGPGDRADDPSQFGGLPWLLPGEAWPVCGECGAPLVFFVQIDLARAPRAARAQFGDGLLQLFHCTACDPYRPFTPAQVVRIVDRAQARPAAEAGAATVFPARGIAGWSRAVQDYPHRESSDIALEPEERAIVFRLNRQGDKLGGWPNWVQDVEHPPCPRGPHRMQQMIVQIDSDRGVPYTWGDNGVGFVFQCAEHRDEVAFVWQCA